ncbi:thiol:disulfide interchange protein [Mucilaginibacter rubeus]|uniref:Thiol:disulfide interchange protein n=1 Tax=Mucilaginibacter rubeus TaxID=2027860 RepID=A0AAE6JG32_9SPHI|nr:MULTISPECIES: cytochrome c biogenesis protein CcdA [Mucilaginibacter]QEM04918.1 thiol:disulfide interchange protein [Mucilaginibacter rubeus]QEM17512.1 thiol:disulfide interchange protein [Mucilaginibacter gossypii]QTE45966.1 hypothetical protein J3L19_11635 [Mucilaginibacter rubeus]QTE52563.1 hypothetical protein J3L21_11605 [Mucilaginibacter rubeus]QTE57652.1 hypothetical protein J3L23_03280 [Mucilaginibacter rubeus]
MTLEDFLHRFGSYIDHGSILAVLIALLAGIIATGICPCTLPVGLGIAGLSGNSGKNNEAKNSGLAISGVFFAGIVVCLTLLGALAGRLGMVLSESFGQFWALAMAIFSLIAAVIAFYGPRLKIGQLQKMRSPGLGGTFIYGFIFSLGTSAAPLLLLISVAAAQASPLRGIILAIAFGIGRGLPFLIVGVFASAVTRFAQLTWLKRSIQLLSACALLFVSYYYIRVFIDLR